MTQPTTQAIEKAREIAACPCCGSPGAYAGSEESGMIFCTQCWMRTGHVSKSSAFRCWNTRALSAAASEREQLEARVKELSDERAELEALRQYAREATKAITSLTAGGSEYLKGRIGEIYVADLPFCLERIRASKSALHRQLAAFNGVRP